MNNKHILYFNDQINEELCGAKDYILKAIKMKGTNDYTNDYGAWADSFAKMAEAEISHAKNLYDMFDEAFKGDPACDSEMGKAVHELVSANYSSGLSKIQELFDKYRSK